MSEDLSDVLYLLPRWLRPKWLDVEAKQIFMANTNDRIADLTKKIQALDGALRGLAYDTKLSEPLRKTRMLPIFAELQLRLRQLEALSKNKLVVTASWLQLERAENLSDTIMLQKFDKERREELHLRPHESEQLLAQTMHGDYSLQGITMQGVEKELSKYMTSLTIEDLSYLDAPPKQPLRICDPTD